MMDTAYDLNLKRSVDMFRRNDRLHRRIFERQAVAAFGIHRSQHMILMYISRPFTSLPKTHISPKRFNSSITGPWT